MTIDEIANRVNYGRLICDCDECRREGAGYDALIAITRAAIEYRYRDQLPLTVQEAIKTMEAL